jgi:hypothetical protein
MLAAQEEYRIRIRFEVLCTTAEMDGIAEEAVTLHGV